MRSTATHRNPFATRSRRANRRQRRGLPGLLGVTLALLASGTASAAPPPVGGLTQLGGQAGCVTFLGGSGACAQARGVDGASSAVVSPDGRNAYLASYDKGSQEGLAVFSRDPLTGTLTQLPGPSGCLSADGSSAAGPDTCTAVRGFGVGDGRGLAFTSDGQWAYLVNQHAQASDPAPAIVVLRRDPTTGALSQLPGTAGCVSSDGSSQDGPGTCQTLATLGQPFGVSISPDDAFVYVTDYASPSRIHVLARDPMTGALSEVQCLSEAPAPAGCATGRVLGDSKTVVLSPDARHAYSSDGTGISVFDRDTVTGLLTQKPGVAGCITDTGNDDTRTATCATGRALYGTSALAISPNGATLYGAASADHGVSLFQVAQDGSLTQIPGTEGCITLSGADGVGGTSCATARALTYPFGLTISPDGRSLYVIADINSLNDGVAVFSLDPASGAATQLPGTAGCITANGTSSGAGVCANGGPALQGIYDPTVSPDGTSVLLPGYDGRTLSVYRRETGPSCQAIAAATAYQTAVTVTLRCQDSDGDPVTTSIVTPPAHGTVGAVNQTAGTVLYTPQPSYSGPDSFTFSASDGTNAGTAVTATVTIAAPVPHTPPAGTSTSGHPRPSLTHLRESSAAWREVRPAPRRAPTAFSFTLNEAARVTLTFTREVAGRRVNGRCVTPTHTNGRARPCRHTVTLGALAVQARAGQTRLAFTGHLPRGGWLPRGRITVTAVASANGQRSAAHHLSFLIRR